MKQVAPLYRVSRENVSSGRDIVEGLVADVPCDVPPRYAPAKSRWLCHNPACVLDEVSVRASHLGGQLPDVMTCSACGEEMALYQHVEEVLLVPAPA